MKFFQFIERTIWIDFKFFFGFEDIIHFFDILKKEREINIDDLLKNNWLNSIPKSGIEKINLEDKYKNYFKERYKTLKEFEDGEKEEIDINSIINTSNNNSFNTSILDFCRSIIDNTNKIDEISKLKIQEIDYKPEGIVFDFIEISISLDEIKDISNFLYTYMLKLEEIIENIDTTKISTQKDDNYLSFSVNVKTEENNNDEIIDDDEINNNEERQDSNNINYNNFIYENENNENEYLNIKIELLKYSKITTDYKEKYYLMFNYIDGEIYDYYNYLKFIKEKAKKLLKK